MLDRERQRPLDLRSRIGVVHAADPRRAEPIQGEDARGRIVEALGHLGGAFTPGDSRVVLGLKVVHMRLRRVCLGEFAARPERLHRLDRLACATRELAALSADLRVQYGEQAQVHADALRVVGVPIVLTAQPKRALAQIDRFGERIDQLQFAGGIFEQRGCVGARFHIGNCQAIQRSRLAMRTDARRPRSRLRREQRDLRAQASVSR